MKRQTMIALAKPSMAESIPKPTSAIDPARMPATIAMVPSAPIQTRLIQDSSLTLRTAAPNSSLGARAELRWGRRVRSGVLTRVRAWCPQPRSAASPLSV